MMNRRAFLKLFVGSVAVATLPIPRFLLKEERNTAFDTYGINAWKGERYDASSGVLTQEMIEEATRRSIENMGAPEKIIMSEQDYQSLRKWFSYRIEYV